MDTKLLNEYMSWVDKSMANKYNDPEWMGAFADCLGDNTGSDVDNAAVQADEDEEEDDVISHTSNVENGDTIDDIHEVE